MLVGDVWELAETVLQAAVDGITTAHPTLLPARQDIWSGATWGRLGCDHLAVHPVQIEPLSLSPDGLPARPTSCSVLPSVTLVVSLLYCVASVDDQGNAPASTTVAADSQRVLRGAAALYTAMTRARRDGVFGPCSGVTLGPAQSVGPQGGIAGTSISITVDPDTST